MRRETVGDADFEDPTSQAEDLGPSKQLGTKEMSLARVIFILPKKGALGVGAF